MKSSSFALYLQQGMRYARSASKNLPDLVASMWRAVRSIFHVFEGKERIRRLINKHEMPQSFDDVRGAVQYLLKTAKISESVKLSFDLGRRPQPKRRDRRPTSQAA